VTSAVKIGIDFGTTNCAVGRITAGGQQSLLGPIPSVIAWRNEQLVFDHEARDLLRSGDETVHPIRDIKLLLGTGQGVHVGRHVLDPIDVAAGLLTHVKNRLVPSETVELAVMATPVRMPREHRVAVRQAAMRAGIRQVRFVYEPTAALIGHLKGKAVSHHGNVLVIDWGGGTLDLAVIRVEGGAFRELTVHGDVRELGGTCIDEKLTENLLSRYPRVRTRLARLEGGFARLKEEVEGEKIDILEDDEAEDGEVRRIVPGWLDDVLELEPALVYHVMREFAGRARERIQESLNQSRIPADDITDVLFAGGVCNSEVVRREVTTAFPHARILEDRHPQLQTGSGCARLTAVPFTVELAADFAARQSDETICVLLPRGQRVELNAYRAVDFMVTDISAAEAVFDFGVCQAGSGTTSMTTADVSTFRSLRHMYVAAGAPLTAGGQDVPELVRVHVGVDSDLSVAVHLHSNRAKARSEENLSAVPLTIRVE
jgi:molecular chaperone DnaK